MKHSTRHHAILHHYKMLINASRIENGLPELTTGQVADEICYYIASQSAEYIGGHFILESGEGE